MLLDPPEERLHPPPVAVLCGRRARPGPVGAMSDNLALCETARLSRLSAGVPVPETAVHDQDVGDDQQVPVGGRRVRLAGGLRHDLGQLRLPIRNSRSRAQAA